MIPKDKINTPILELSFRSKILNLQNPVVMAILNVTPDSFFDGGLYTDELTFLNKAESLLEEGADILDIGGYSTRPGAQEVSEEEELNRVLPAIENVKKKFPDAILSIDTFRSRVAKEATDRGVEIINDVSGGILDPQMYDVVAASNCYYILMHMRGTPQTRQQFTHYENLTENVISELEDKILSLNQKGVDKIILDPGFGFSKTLEQNYDLLSHLSKFKSLNLPVVVGVSRKSMIYKLLNCLPENALNGTSVVHTLALLQGANLLRVHDVKEAKQTIRIVQEYKK